MNIHADTSETGLPPDESSLAVGDESGVGDGIQATPTRWTFGEEVPLAFMSHVRRSVPLYDAFHEVICETSDFFCQPDGLVYELGTSTGQLIRRLAERHAHRPRMRFVGLDVEDAMIAQARTHCDAIENIKLQQADITTYDYETCDFVVAYLTLAFVERQQRAELATRIYESLRLGGALCLYEKIRAPDARMQDIVTSLYRHFKLRNGFTETEIANKTDSLTGVMDPQTQQENFAMLRDAGFSSIMSIGGSLCFDCVIAVK